MQPASLELHQTPPPASSDGWTLCATAAPELAEPFGSLQRIFQLQGEQITRDAISDVLRVEVAGRCYYVKRYRSRGKNLRYYIGRSRVQAEWENLQYFERLGIPCAPLVGYGQSGWGSGFHGALITRELADTQDLAELAQRGDARLQRPEWVAGISRQLAAITRTLHRHRFAHNDLKWRNLLVNSRGELFLIDCPGGRFWRGPMLRYRVIKDLACLDKVARQHLSRSQRLRFYLAYLGRPRLERSDRRQLSRMLRYMDVRDC